MAYNLDEKQQPIRDQIKVFAEKEVLPGTHYSFLKAPPELLEVLAHRLRVGSGPREPEPAG